MTRSQLPILVAEDDVMARMTAAQSVKQGGHTATMADGGAAAIEMLQSENFDLDLLDPDLLADEITRCLDKTSSE